MKKYLQQTATDFINHLRLDYAANLLYHTDFPIIKVAFESGFNNLSHFNHLFKKKDRITPYNFRKAAANKSLNQV
jgi:AraC family cel operon transcriptional repressor